MTPYCNCCSWFIQIHVHKAFLSMNWSQENLILCSPLLLLSLSWPTILSWITSAALSFTPVPISKTEKAPRPNRNSAHPLSYSYSDASVHAGDKLNQLSKFCRVYSSLRLSHSSSSLSANMRGCQQEDVNHPFTLSSSCHTLHRVTPVPTFVLISSETPCFIPLASPFWL